MCGRYALYSKNQIKSKFKIDVIENFNISPNQNVLIINNENKPVRTNWGINPKWTKSTIINARIETLDSKRTFSDLSRCVFIADGYYEWNRSIEKKTPYYHYIDNDFLYFAGLYDELGCVIVTMKGFNYLSMIHDRQPLFLQENQIESWIKNENSNIIFNKTINFHEVSRSINKALNNSSMLIEPI